MELAVRYTGPREVWSGLVWPGLGLVWYTAALVSIQLFILNFSVRDICIYAVPPRRIIIVCLRIVEYNSCCFELSKPGHRLTIPSVCFLCYNELTVF